MISIQSIEISLLFFFFFILGSLTALVCQHSITPLALPCKLIIPDRGEVLTHITGRKDSLMRFWGPHFSLFVSSLVIYLLTVFFILWPTFCFSTLKILLKTSWKRRHNQSPTLLLSCWNRAQVSSCLCSRLLWNDIVTMPWRHCAETLTVLCHSWKWELPHLPTHCSSSCYYGLPDWVTERIWSYFYPCAPAACNVWYLCSVEMESLTGVQAVQKATSMTLSSNPPPSSTVVHFKVSSQGITLTDNQRKWVPHRHIRTINTCTDSFLTVRNPLSSSRLFFRRHYNVNTVIFCALDPQDRKWVLLIIKVLVMAFVRQTCYYSTQVRLNHN